MSRGGSQKSKVQVSQAPLPLSCADFFPADVNFDLFGHPIDDRKGSLSASGGRGSRKTTVAAEAVRRLAEEGHTRLQIAKQVGISQSTLYANFFPEIGGRRGCPGRRLHEPSDERRALVRSLCRDRATLAQIATAIGISEPTLRRAYAVELATRKDYP